MVLRSVLRSRWIDSKGRVVNFSYIFGDPKSKHVTGHPQSLPLILNKRAPKHIVEALKAKEGPALAGLLGFADFASREPQTLTPKLNAHQCYEASFQQHLSSSFLPLARPDLCDHEAARSLSN